MTCRALLSVALVMSGATFCRADWKVAPLNGAPALFHNGKPVPLVLYMPHAQAPDKDYLDVSKAGLHLYNVGASWHHYGNPYWRKDGSFSLAFTESRLDQILRLDANAAVMPRLYTTAPDWWREAHPEERIAFAGIPDMNAAVGQDVRLRGPGYRANGHRESFASLACREGVTPYYRKAVRRLYDKYGDALAGIHVAGGPCGEHFTWDEWFSFPLGQVPPPYGDVSEPMRQAFARYLRQKYADDVLRLRDAWQDASVTFENVRCPTKVERESYDATGVWRDPAVGRKIPDYHEALHATTVEMISHYSSIVKKETGGKVPTLVFYGYTQDEPWSSEADHRAPAKLYRCDSVNMYSAPHTYKRRKPGEDGGMRQYLASAALHGRLFIDEGDDNTHLELKKKNPDPRALAKDMDESVHLLYREFGQAVTHGVGLWYMDLMGGFFRDPILLDTMGRMHKWGEVALRHDRAHHSEVAIVSNPESEFYLGARSTTANNVNLVAYIQQMGAFYSAGAPFDWYLADDLEAVEKGGYKVVVLLDCQFLRPEQLTAVERLKNGGRTLVFFHAPAYAAERDLSLARTERTVGFKMEIVPGETPLQAIDKASGALLGSELRQKSLFLPIVQPTDKVFALGVSNLVDRPVVVRRDCGDWRSVHVAVPAISDTALHEIYREAGVHLYSDAGVVLSANKSWVMLHTRTAKDYRVSLPKTARKVTEITTEKTVGENISSFVWPLDKFRTAVFLVE